MTPPQRIRSLNPHGLRNDGRWVVYWMTAARRLAWNFALDRAVEWAARLKLPLVVIETLPSGVRWASLRHHRFVLDGMREHAAALAGGPVQYYPFVERGPDEALELMSALSRQAAILIVDDYPVRSFAEAAAGLAGAVEVAVEAVDGNGLLPMAAAPTAFTVAHSFRRHLQKTLREHLLETPAAKPLGRKLPTAELPAEIIARFPPTDLPGASLAGLPIDQSVPASGWPGGNLAARKQLADFVARRLDRYDEARNHPDDDASSGLSAYLHFGFVSAHEVFHAVAKHEGWSPDRLASRVTGKPGWYGMSPAAESFLDEVVTWRELSFNGCRWLADYDRYDTLPAWAQSTLAKHARDRRPVTYSLDQLAAAETHDPLWNAAQRQLVREGRLHNYLRMLWGKKILQWTASPQESLAVMIELNNRYALDGQDPCSYAGIFWVLGRYDRAWGPERPIFGTIRYMTSENTARKVRVREYLARYS